MKKRETKRSIKSSETKKLIADTGRKLMRQYGYDNMTIQQICMEAKITNGTFYHYFPTKHALLSSIFPRESDQFEMLSKEPLTDPQKVLDRYIKSWCDTYESFQPENLYTAIFIPDAGNKTMYEEKRPLYCYLLNGMTRAKEAGKLKADTDVEALCLKLVICANGILHWACTTCQGKVCLESMFQSVMSVLLEKYLA